MKRLFLTLMAILTMTSATCSSKSDKTGNTWKLMSYNIKSGMGMDNIVDYDRTAAVINASQPDVVALQEVDSITTRRKGKYVAGELAQRTGMKASFGPAINFQGGKYGLALLTRQKPRKVWRHQLPGREEQRTLLIADMGNYAVGCVHLSLTKEDRMKSVDIIRKAFAAIKKPCFLMGDFNETPDGSFIKEMCNYFDIISDTTELTFPADRPDRTIDYIMAFKGKRQVGVKSFKVIAEPKASDHRPLCIEVTKRK